MHILHPQHGPSGFGRTTISPNSSAPAPTPLLRIRKFLPFRHWLTANVPAGFTAFCDLIAWDFRNRDSELGERRASPKCASRIVPHKMVTLAMPGTRVNSSFKLMLA